ncbi:MAG TPA: TadE family protein [Qipengyuania sp.]|nr:TadE family protein [Qipengyuania sp.]
MTHCEPNRPARESRLARLRRLRRDKDGIAVTEFAFVAPIFLLMLMGIFDQGFAMYIQSALQGAVQDGARQASLENTLFADIEAKVNQQVRNVVPTSDPSTEITFTLDPTYYQNYNEIGMPEDFEDKFRGSPAVKNGTYDADECFVDRNGNRQWDQDVGLAGRGGAQDVVSIKASLSYKRIFPFWKMIGQPQTQVLTATTFLRNQPFSAQATRVGVRICPT